jgi:hypothetical protein
MAFSYRQLLAHGAGVGAVHQLAVEFGLKQDEHVEQNGKGLSAVHRMKDYA